MPESSGNGIQTPAGCDEPVPWRPYPTMVIVVPTVGKPGCPGCNVSSLTGAMLVTFTGWASEMTAMSFWTEGDGPRDEVRVPDETGGVNARAGDGGERYGNALIWSEAMGRRQDGARIDFLVDAWTVLGRRRRLRELFNSYGSLLIVRPNASRPRKSEDHRGEVSFWIARGSCLHDGAWGRWVPNAQMPKRVSPQVGWCRFTLKHMEDGG